MSFYSITFPSIPLTPSHFQKAFYNKLASLLGVFYCELGRLCSLQRSQRESLLKLSSTGQALLPELKN